MTLETAAETIAAIISIAVIAALAAIGLGCRPDRDPPAPDASRPPLVIEPLTAGTDASLRGLSVVDDRVAWASGSDGWAGATTDGGATWRFARVAGHEQRDFRDVEGFSAARALIVAVGSPGLILDTADAGATWHVRFRDDRPEIFLDGIACLDQRRCLVLGDPIDGRFLLIVTEDGGVTWTERRGPEALAGEAAFAASGTAIAFDRHGEIAIGTGGTQPRVLISSDFGSTWRPELVPLAAGAESRGVFSLVATRDASWVAVGGDHTAPESAAGTAARRDSDDAESSWSAAASPPSGYRSSVGRLDDGTLIATGPNGTDLSADGGASWKSLSTEGFHAVACARRGSLVLLAGAGGRLARLRPLGPAS